ncbi:MAG: PD-(D/E)XK nuclease family protein [Saprospiraceae bacterium]
MPYRSLSSTSSNRRCACKGVIDRIDILNDQHVRIVDYKTGSHNPDKIKSARSTDPKGGSYWRQLIFYKLLWENRPAELRTVKETFIQYLDMNAEGNITAAEVPIEEGHTRLVKQLLKDSYDRIMAHDFYTGCGEPSCEWCRFANENLLPPTFSQEEVEALDDNS